MNQTFPRIMLVDMNSFFASVEQQANPFYRGKPLGVSPSNHPTSCLIGTSKEAKAMGIKNGIPLYKARKICPKIIVVPSEPEKYREVSRQVNRIFLDYTPLVEPYSVDESFLDLREINSSPRIGEVRRGRVKTYNLPPLAPPILGGESNTLQNVLLIGAEIKRRIREEIGEWLTCSVGIAPNKFMAKLAADLEKPDGLSIIWRENLREVYEHKKLSDLWGINHGWTKRLEKLGIYKPAQLLDYPVQNLISLFGKSGFYLWQRVNGLEIDSIVSSPSTGEDVRSFDRTDEGGLSHPSPGASRHPLPQGERENLKITSQKSFGNSWVLNFRTTNKDRLKLVILRLAEKASRRMRDEGMIASGMYLSVTLVDGEYFARSKKLKFQIETGLQLFEQAMQIWKPWEFRHEVMHIRVGFTHLQRRIIQLALFTDKFLTLTKTLDVINDKYGEFTIRSGLLTQTSSFAPDAIAFGK